MTHVPQNFKILAVDDNRVTRTIVQNALDNAGYNVMMADSGEAALPMLWPVGLSPLVRALKIVVLPELGKPIMPSFIS